MSLVLHPRVASPDRLRVWLGAFDRTAAPALSWTLDGQPRTPTALRPIASVRRGPLLNGNPPRAFSGVYEFRGLTPNTAFTVGVTADSGQATLAGRTLPAEVPSGLDARFNVLLVSCFHWEEDREGRAGDVVASLTGAQRPHLTLLLGDQVYLDLPTLMDFKDDAAWLAEKFEMDYVRNWRGPAGYAKILAAAPSVAIPDDHEFWNNYPHASPIIQNSYSPGGRRRWRAAALATYEGFQLDAPAATGRSLVVDVPPLSFFLADTRTFRDPALGHSLPSPLGLKELRAWVQQVRAKGAFGVFVNGQSVLSPAATGLSGSVGDRELPNYKDFPDIARILQQLMQAGREALCITGDVHWGRMANGTDVASGRTILYEIISSPSSLVTTIGKDQWAGLSGMVGGWFGKRNPWPRHSDPDPTPEFFAQQVLGRMIHCATVHGQKGDQVVLLSFRRAGFGLELRVTYFPIHPEIRTPVELAPIRLGPR
jgi:hypothetical protein